MRGRTVELIEALLNPDTQHPHSRAMYREALAEFQADQRHVNERAVAADPDPELARRQLDADLVEDAIRRHAVEMLKLSVHKPHPGEIFPAMPYAMATWHLLRINALRAAPLDVAAAQLREEALNALSTNPKEAS